VAAEACVPGIGGVLQGAGRGGVYMSVTIGLFGWPKLDFTRYGGVRW
jgi:hypothetical protein